MKLSNEVEEIEVYLMHSGPLATCALQQKVALLDRQEDFFVIKWQV